MANYTKEKSRYGGFVGSILVHSTPGIGTNNDPTTAIYKKNLPAGYLKCDGSIRNAKDFYALSQVIGVGDDCRFKKEGTVLRNADPTQNDLGQFQLPDLGSKVVLAGRSTGVYTATTVETTTGGTAINKVGPEVEVLSNVGNTISVEYSGNFQISASQSLNMLGNPKFNYNTTLSSTALDIENFRGHAHNSSQTYLNYSAQHKVGGSGPAKNRNVLAANSGGGNTLEETSLNTSTPSIHNHKIIKPTVFNPHNFTYSHGTVQVSAENLVSSIDIKTSNIKKLDQVVTPFILVEYLIKF